MPVVQLFGSRIRAEQFAADWLRVSTADGLTATGSTRDDALLLSAEINRVTTAAAGTGVCLLAVGVGGRLVVYNDAAETVQIYAPGSATIDGSAGATGVALSSTKRCGYVCVDDDTWISAQLGPVSA